MLMLPLIGVLFGSPLAAAAVAGGAVAVPVLIHLLNRKRYVVVPWAAMRFLLAAQKKNVRRLKLEQWLLLATRTLLVLLLVLAMAAVMPWFEPAWQRLFPGEALGGPAHGRTHKIIVLDGSFTMATRRADDVSRFDAARAQARALLERSNPGDGYSVVLLGSPAQVIVPGPADDRERVAREVDQLKLAHGSADVAGGLHAVAEMVAKSKAQGKYARREVYFLSDVRRSAWPLPAPEAPSGDGPVGASSGPAESWARILDAAQVAVIDVAGRDVENLAVTSVSLGDPLPLVQTNLALTATVHNHGRTERTQVPVSLLLYRATDPGAPTQLAQKLVDIPPNTTVTVAFALDRHNRFREAGQYVLQVRAGEDALRPDDARSLAVVVRDSIPVMVVNGKPSSDPLDRASGFLTRALNPFPDGERSPESPARVRVLSPREFQDAGLGDLFRPDEPTDVVFLCDLPAVGGNEAARLEAHLKRGGSVVIGLGPNAARNIEAYNRVLFNDGKGLLPGPLVGVRRAPDGQHFSLVVGEDGFKKPPLAAFRTETEQASFATPRFGRYVRLDLPRNGPARRIFNFVPAGPAVEAGPLDPAVVESPRHRGRVIVFTSSLNTDWNDWPRMLSYPPFVQELLRFAVARGTRQTVTVGEPLEEYVPAAFAGLSASVTFEDGTTGEPIPVVAQDEAGLVRVPATDRSGVYRVNIAGKHESVFAANVPTVSPTGGAESDLRRLTAADFTAAAPTGDIQVVGDASAVRFRVTPAATGGESDLAAVQPRGPSIARILLFAVLGLMAVELVLAWLYGSARVGQGLDPMRVRPARWLTPLWVIPLAILAVTVAVVVHAVMTGEFLGFLPDSLRTPIERWVGVPAAAPGEGTRWRLETHNYWTGDDRADRWLVAGALLVAGLCIWQVYRRERPGASATGPLGRWRSPRVRLGVLRFGLVALVLVVLLPQVKLAFEREGWPDVVVLIDDSRSMSVVDTFRDPAVQAKADELRREWERIAAPRIRDLEARAAEIRSAIAKDPSSADAGRLREELGAIEARAQDLKTPHRLNLIKAMLATGSGEWLKTFLHQRRMRVHLYRISDQATRLAELSDADQSAPLLNELMDQMPTGESSQVGTGVESVLKTFRGGSLNAIVVFSDGVVTAGEELPAAARSAARAGVPLHLAGVGDATEPPDLSVTDLRAEDVVHVNDRLVIDVRLMSRGIGMPDLVPVVLSEVKDGRPVELARETVRTGPSGQPVKVRFVHQPKEAGEKTFVVQVPVQPDEADAGNNRLEHRVYVAEARRLRVLLVEGYPRWDWRYVKSLFERESDETRGNKSIEVHSFLVSADPEHPKQDRTSINRFPTPEELKTYDVVVLGDVDPKSLPRSAAVFESLAKYVKDEGGGLIMLAGSHANPHAYRDTALADVMPVVCDGPAPAGEPARESFRPKLTPAGQGHPLFRFSPEEAENAEIWSRLPPLTWHSHGYRRKLSAEVLAVHPDRPAETPAGSGRDENHPLILQQFVGAGRVLFLGFDDTWRWRLRESEVRFNQFWLQAVQALARGRIGRTEVRTDRKLYRRDQPVRVTVRFPDDAPPPEGPVKLTVDRIPTRQAGAEIETQTIELAPREGVRATFEALITRTPEGEYIFTLVNPATPGQRPRAEARVLPPPGELDRTRLNESDLRRAARDSRGAYYPLDKVGDIPTELPGGPRVALDQPCEPFSIWNSPAVFVLALGLLTAEWVMRKKWRLL